MLFITSLRISLVTLLICVAGYTAAILGFARVASPDTAEGSLVSRPDGTIVGSRLIAQKFEGPGYIWSRPSAPDYDAMAAAGSNKSPTSDDLTERAAGVVAVQGASTGALLPADLAAASGSGLDPHISERAALYQAPRVAAARGVARERVEALVRTHAAPPGGPLTPDRIVNVLELNLALDAELELPAANQGAQP